MSKRTQSALTSFFKSKPSRPQHQGLSVNPEPNVFPFTHLWKCLHSIKIRKPRKDGSRVKEPKHHGGRFAPKRERPFRAVVLEKTQDIQVSESQEKNIKDPLEKKKALIRKYQKEFVWILDQEDGLYCSYCIRYCRALSITTFQHDQEEVYILKPGIFVKKDLLNKHNKRLLHLQAALEYGTEKEKMFVLAKLRKNNTDINSFLDKVKKEASNVLLYPLFKAIYYISKRNLSLVEAERLVEFLGENDVQICDHYRNRTSLTEMLDYISNDVRMDLVFKLKSAKVLGIMIDETSDITMRKLLTLNVKYVDQGAAKTSFLCLLELEKGDAQTVYKRIKDILKSFGLYSKVASICTDGAKVMASTKNGVCGLIQKDKPGIFSLHCISHKLNLAVVDLWKTDKDLSLLNTLMFNLCKVFSKSSNKIKLLSDYEKELCGFTLKLIKPIDIRWMSKFSAIQRLMLLYPAIIKTLLDLIKGGDAISMGLLAKLLDFKVVAYLHILTDIYFIFKPLHLKLQKQDLNFEGVEASYNFCKISLENMINSEMPGKLLAYLFDEVKKNNFIYKKIKLKGTEEDITFMAKRNIDIAKMALISLTSRLGNIETFIPFQIFDVSKIRNLTPGTPKFADYGLEKLKTLVSPFRADFKKIEEQWHIFKTFAYAYKKLELDEFWKIALESSEIESLHQLIETYLSFPLSTNDCERVFSKVSLIKTKIRNQMKARTLDHLLNVSLNAPKLSEYDFDVAIQDWKDLKNRYFCESE